MCSQALRKTRPFYLLFNEGIKTSKEVFFPHVRSSATSTFVSEEEMMVLEMVYEIKAD